MMAVVMLKEAVKNQSLHHQDGNLPRFSGFVNSVKGSRILSITKV